MFNQKEYNKKYYQEHKEKYKEYNDNRVKKNPNCHKEYYQKHKQERKECYIKYKQEHKKETSEYNKKYYKEHKKERKEYNKKWEQKNRKERKEYRKEYRKNHKEEAKKCKKQWINENRDKVNFDSLRKKARKKNAKGSHTLNEWQTLKAECDYTCQMCGLKEPFEDQYYKFLTEDHKIPLSKGGTDYIDNIQPLCHSCNSKKGTEII